MRYLPLLSRFAFICNVLFSVAVLLRWFPVHSAAATMYELVSMGFLLACVCSPLVVLGYIILWVRRKALFAAVPRWLVLGNCVFFVLQIIYFFINEYCFS